MKRLVGVLVYAALVVGCGGNESAPTVGVTGLEFQHVTREGLIAAAEWCATDEICSHMSQDNAPVIF
jgi:hypothetical protein